MSRTQCTQCGKLVTAKIPTRGKPGFYPHKHKTTDGKECNGHLFEGDNGKLFKKGEDNV